MPHARYLLWQCISNDAGLWLLILVGTICLASVVWLLAKDRKSPWSGLWPAGVVAIFAAPFFWWFLLNLVDRKTGLPEPSDFGFVKDLGRDIASCAYAKESPLVIQVTFCGIGDRSVQNRVLADMRSKNRYDAEKPIVVTFRANSERQERVSGDGAKTVWFTGGQVTREELLIPRSNIRSQSDAPTAARA